jgi:hypothetical protein
VHLCNGQEAIYVGACAALDLRRDAVFPTYRDHGWAIACGAPLSSRTRAPADPYGPSVPGAPIRGRPCPVRDLADGGRALVKGFGDFLAEMRSMRSTGRSKQAICRDSTERSTPLWRCVSTTASSLGSMPCATPRNCPVYSEKPPCAAKPGELSRGETAETASSPRSRQGADAAATATGMQQARRTHLLPRGPAHGGVRDPRPGRASPPQNPRSATPLVTPIVLRHRYLAPDGRDCWHQRLRQNNDCRQFREAVYSLGGRCPV